jgi:hypothetical protein
MEIDEELILGNCYEPNQPESRRQEALDVTKKSVWDFQFQFIGWILRLCISASSVTKL